MLGVGLTTEAVIFFLSAFEPKKSETDWKKVYPELAEDYEGPSTSRQPAGSLAEKLDDVFAQADIDAALIEKLGKGMQHLAESVTQMSSLSSASVATEEYINNVEKASEALVGMREAYGTTLNSFHEMANIAQNAKAYHEQIQNITESLTTLNSVYRSEIQEANLHLKATNELYSNVAQAMGKMQEAGTEAEAFKEKLASLNEKISSLNGIYGNMLTAIRG